jgi:hypothetical protein
MANHAKISVSFELERRGEVIYFRAAHKPDAVWHGPYGDLAEITETIAHYISEDAIEAWYVEQPSMVDASGQSPNQKTWIVEKLRDAFVAYTTEVAADTADQAWRIANAHDFGGIWVRGDVREYDDVTRGEITEISPARAAG